MCVESKKKVMTMTLEFDLARHNMIYLGIASIFIQNGKIMYMLK